MLPVYYINLDARTDRRAFIEAQCAALGIVAQRVPAVTIADLDDSLKALPIRPGRLWRVNPGDIACGLSHRRAWRMMLERGEAEALILEDDAVISPDILPLLAGGLAQRLRADLVRLETQRRPVALGHELARFDGFGFHELGSTHRGAAAYVITRATAERGLQWARYSEMAPDRFLFGHGGPNLWRRRVLQCVPSPVVQLDARGDAPIPIDTPGVDVAIRSDIESQKSPTRRKSRGRRPLDVIGLELSLLWPRVAQMLRAPAVLLGRRRVPFSGDKTS